MLCMLREREREKLKYRCGAVAVEMSAETQISIAAFPGFRFSPTDEELLSYYLKKKLEGSDKCVEVIAEVEISKHEPWDLPEKSVIKSENEWFFFTPRGRKYPNGTQSKRATESGYWKATGKERNVKSGCNVIGTKRTLVFHMGRAPKGERTEWIMHEYCMNGMSQESLVVCRLRKNSEFRLNDSPRQGSLSQRDILTDNNSVSEVGGVEQSGVLDGAKAIDCCSKECSSSYNSHSVEQLIECGSDSNQKIADGFSYPGSSSHQQGCDDEDCYAEILKDDIVDLGESFLPPTPDLLPVVTEKSNDEGPSQEPVQAFPSNVHPIQGTASRRIRLRQKSLGIYRGKVLANGLCHRYSIKEFIRPNFERMPKCWLSLLPYRSLKRSSMLGVFIILTLLVLLVSLLGVPWRVRSFT